MSHRWRPICLKISFIIYYILFKHHCATFCLHYCVPESCWKEKRLIQHSTMFLLLVALLLLLLFVNFCSSPISRTKINFPFSWYIYSEEDLRPTGSFISSISDWIERNICSNRWIFSFTRGLFYKKQREKKVLKFISSNFHQDWWGGSMVPRSIRVYQCVCAVMRNVIDRNHFPHKHWRWIKVQCKVLPLSPITIDETHVMMVGAPCDPLGVSSSNQRWLSCLWHGGEPVAAACPLLALIPVHARPLLSQLAAIFRARFTCFLCLSSRQLSQSQSRTHLNEIMWTAACLHVHICCMQSSVL